MNVVEQDVFYARSTIEYQPKYQQFIVQDKNYSFQYNKLYLQRLNQFKPMLSEQAVRKWGISIPILEKIIDVETEHLHNGHQCILIGTIYKEMSLRGSAIDEFKDSYGISGVVQSIENLASEGDSLILEDESGRIVLSKGSGIADLIGELVTGVTCAILGTINSNGEFVSSDYTFCYDVEEQQEEVENFDTKNTKDKFLVLISGLLIGEPDKPSNQESGVQLSGDFSKQLFVDFVSGRVGNPSDAQFASQITRVIIAGDSVVTEEATNGKDRGNTKNQNSSHSPCHQFDVLLSSLLSSIPVDLLPGLSDPANLLLPQQPLHPCLFPHSSRFSTLNRVSNPFHAAIDDIKILGTSGQPVSDISRQCLMSSSNSSDKMDCDDGSNDETKKNTEKPSFARLHILKNTLKWGHLCPTAPDTLPCHPFTTEDPFIIQENLVPQIFFAGNQPKFSSSLVKLTDGKNKEKLVRLICAPVFHNSGQAVVVNISKANLPCSTLSFA